MRFLRATLCDEMRSAQLVAGEAGLRLSVVLKCQGQGGLVGWCRRFASRRRAAAGPRKAGFLEKGGAGSLYDGDGTNGTNGINGGILCPLVPLPSNSSPTNLITYGRKKRQRTAALQDAVATFKPHFSAVFTKQAGVTDSFSRIRILQKDRQNYWIIGLSAATNE